MCSNPEHCKNVPIWHIGGEKVGFGAVLRACRERAGLTQEQLAEKLHRSRSCISKFESDKKTLDVMTLIRWTDVTNSKEIAYMIVSGIEPMMILQQMMTMIGGLISWLRIF